MNDSDPTIKCKKCGGTFQPDMRTNGVWTCPNCQANNTNLKRHYRSVADLCILGLIATVYFLVLVFNNDGLDFGAILIAADAVLLLVTIVFVYRSKTPWQDRTVKMLIWMVFGLAFLSNVIVPFLILGTLNIPALVIYAIIFPYLFWLNSQASKSRVTTPAR